MLPRGTAKSCTAFGWAALRGGVTLVLVASTLVSAAPANAAPADQEGPQGTSAGAPDATTMEQVCAWFEEDKDFIEGVKTTKDAFEFVKLSAEEFAKAPNWIVLKALSVQDAVSWILTHGVTRIEVIRISPEDGVVHYQHQADYQDEQDAYVAVWVYAEFEYQDRSSVA